MAGPREIHDPELGVLRFERGSWRGVTPAGLRIWLESGNPEPDTDLLKKGVEALRSVAAFESRARAFLSSSARRHPWPPLTLGAVMVARPRRGWIPSHAADTFSGLAAAVFGGVPVISLVFDIAGERDVVDVTFVGDVPVAWDAH